MKSTEFNNYLNQFRNGEVKGLEEIYREYNKKIFGSAILIVRNYVFAEDVVSNVFINIADYSLRNKRHIQNPSAWIYQITKNASFKLLAQENIKNRVEFSEELLPDINSFQSNVEFIVDFYRVIEMLSEKNKEYAVLHYIYELKYKQIAMEFGVTVKSVQRSFDNIKNHFKKYFK